MSATGRPLRGTAAAHGSLVSRAAARSASDDVDGRERAVVLKGDTLVTTRRRRGDDVVCDTVGGRSSRDGVVEAEDATHGGVEPERRNGGHRLRR